MLILNYTHTGDWEGNKQNPQNNCINTGNSLDVREFVHHSIIHMKNPAR
jgi:hypothetical protein